jgi:hypothetical protein
MRKHFIFSNNSFVSRFQDIKDSRQSGEVQRVLSKGRSLLARPRNLSSETSSQSGVSEGQGHIGEGQTGESHDVEGRTEGQGEGAVVTPRSGNGGSNSKNPDFQEILTGKLVKVRVFKVIMKVRVVKVILKVRVRGKVKEPW